LSIPNEQGENIEQISNDASFCYSGNEAPGKLSQRQQKLLQITPFSQFWMVSNAKLDAITLVFQAFWKRLIINLNHHIYLI